MSARTQVRLMIAALLVLALLVVAGPEVVRPNPPSDVRVQ